MVMLMGLGYYQKMANATWVLVRDDAIKLIFPQYLRGDPGLSKRACVRHKNLLIYPKLGFTALSTKRKQRG
jgi:hypothetical protein